MSWLARLKTGKTPEKDASETTENVSVVFVAPTLATFKKNETIPAAANDPASEPTPITAKVDIATIGTPLPLVSSLAQKPLTIAAGSLPRKDPAFDCRSNSPSLHCTEMDLFTARLHRLAEKGLTRADSEALANRLVIRDRETDDRRYCLECRFLSGYGHTSWRCGNWHVAGVAIRPRDTQLPADLVLQLQRCDGFQCYGKV